MQTTYRQHFPSLPPDIRPEYKRVPPRAQEDEELISGHIGNDLKVNGINQKSKVWPYLCSGAEEYDDYLKRMQLARHPAYDLYFKCFDFDFDRAEQSIRNQRKTCYQLSYSPNEFHPRKVVCRFNLKEIQDYRGDVPSDETIYSTYYDRARKPPLFNEIWREMLTQPRKSYDRPVLDFEGRKMGTTVYNVDLCEPAREMSKGHKLKTGPIDRYTLRKI